MNYPKPDVLNGIPFNREILLLTIEELRKVYSTSEELIPAYSENEIEELLMCVERVYCGYHNSLEERLCSILFNITKGHFLSNGNKRVATILTVVIFSIEVTITKELKDFNHSEYQIFKLLCIKYVSIYISEFIRNKLF